MGRFVESIDLKVHGGKGLRWFLYEQIVCVRKVGESESITDVINVTHKHILQSSYLKTIDNIIDNIRIY